MVLSAGDRLGTYEIRGPLGAGGMGEVYRATDTRLGRDVAIKVLPAEVARDAERLARFQREARLLASLNHPHIAAIHGLEDVDGQPFLVLELVEGEDLKQRLDRGPIPLEEALEIARQIAAALEEAHAQGIVHRDLKPANVTLTPDGKVKVLDFGLAKVWAGEAPGGAASAAVLSEAPTVQGQATAAGVVLGTAAYMSPEQARGRAVDKRADVWSFGVVLWEMLTGRRLFTGDSVAEVVSAVLTQEIDLDGLPAATPTPVRRLLERCLRKDPRRRLPDIGAARLELEDTVTGAGRSEGSEPDLALSAAERQRHRRERWAWAAALLTSVGVAAAALLAVFGASENPDDRPAARFVLDLPADLKIHTNRGPRPPAVSPDGRHVAIVGETDRVPQIWIRSLDLTGARALPTTEDAQHPFWSPDGRSIAFEVRGELEKLSLDGGAAQRICTLPRPGPSFLRDVQENGYPIFFGGTWNDEGTIVFSVGGDLFAVPEAGGEPRRLTSADESADESGRYWPQFLPDGHHFLVLVDSTDTSIDGLHVGALDTPDQKRRLMPAAAAARYAGGHLLFEREGTVYARRLDVERLSLTGEPFPIAHDVFSSRFLRFGAFGASDGVFVHGGNERPYFQLTWVDRTGENLGTLGGPRPYHQISLSRDGSRVALEVFDGPELNLWIMDVSRGVARRMTNELGAEVVWSPDGHEVIHLVAGNVVRRGLDAGAAAVPLFDTAADGRLQNWNWPESWSSDGEILFYIRSNDIWALPLGAGGSPELVLDSEYELDEAHLSPDGRWLAYISNESGDWEAYIQPFRRPGEKIRVSSDGGGQPKWRRDGQELFFVSRRNRLTAVELREETSGLVVGLPRELFEIPVVNRPQVDDYAVSPDGQRFLVKTPAEEGSVRKLRVLVNWTSLLE